MRFFKVICALTFAKFLGLAGSATASEPVLLSISSSQNPVSVGKTFDLTATLRSIWRAPFGELHFEGLSDPGFNNYNYDQLIYTAPDDYSITAGFAHSCALDQNGAAYCWGENATYGQLGSGGSVNINTPTAVSGLAAGNRAIVAGDTSTCVLTSEGGVKCWGNNAFGQLGADTGTATLQRVPVDVTGLTTGVRQIAAGGSHFCAVKSDYSAVCWGRNSFGQLGNGSLANATTPVAVSGLPSGTSGNVTSLALGSNHSCALLASGEIYCWGRANSGQLGYSTTPAARSASPVLVDATGVGGFTILAAGGNTTCAVASFDGSNYCWGAGTDGQIGDNGLVNRNTPSKVATLLSFEKLAVGSAHVCGLEASGRVSCWGDGSAMQLGRNGATNDEPSPEEVFDLHVGVTAIAAGGLHTCALLFSGATMCWGEGGSGQLGAADFADSGTPLMTYTAESYTVQVEMGTGSACSLTHTGRVYCWGYNGAGSLGNGTTDNSNSPVLVSALSKPIYRLASFFNTPCALGYDGMIRCWGYGISGQIGDGSSSTRTSPVDVSGFPADAKALTTGSGHSCALDTNGHAYCWGNTASGALGNGEISAGLKNTPVAVTTTTARYNAIAAAGNTTCAAEREGDVECWGSNSSGQIGAGLTDPAYATPQVVTGLSGSVLDIAAGTNHFCVIDGDLAVKCWGSNSKGALGQPLTTTSSNVPVAVSGLPAQAVKLALGKTNSCALLVDGRIYCWGLNEDAVFGAVGNSTTGDPTPVEVTAFGRNALSITANNNTSCVIVPDEGIKCMGNGSTGQLGHGKYENSATAVPVTGTDALAVIRSVVAKGISGAIGSYDLQASYSYGMVGIRDIRFNAALTPTLTQSVINRAPVLADLALSATEDSGKAGTLTASDADGHSITYSVVTQPSKGMLTLTASTGAYIYTPNANGAKTDSFVVRATDAYNATDDATVTVTIKGKKLTGSTIFITATEDKPKSGIVSLTGTDAGDGVTFARRSGPTHGKLTVDKATGAYVYTPNGNGAIRDRFVIRGTDVYGGFADTVVDVQIVGLILTGDSKPNRFIGGDAADLLDGKGGNDFLDGRLGTDVMIGGNGDDIYVVDNSGDILRENKGEGYDTVWASANFILPAEVEALVLTGSRPISGTGNASANRLTGNAAANHLKGLAGNDVIEGRGGRDVLDGGRGRDQLSYAGSKKPVTVNLETGKTSGGDATGDRISGFEDILGSPSGDILTGDRNANRITGGKGLDRITGGKGRDRFIYSAVADSLAKTPDVIADFSVTGRDLVDLARIDANVKTPARNDAFIYLKAGQFTKKPGQLRFANGRLEGDVTGDGKADLVVLLPGVAALPSSRLVK